MTDTIRPDKRIKKLGFRNFNRFRVAKKLGFEFSRQAGTSHAVYKRKSDKRRVIIPNHPAQNVKRKTLAAIISDLGITVDEFRKLL